MIKDEQLTPETRRELNSILKDNVSAFNMLVENYNKNGLTELDSNKVVTRLQAQYFALNRDENSIKTANGWSHNEYNEPNEVNFAISPVVENLYTSFALKTISDTFELNYPLDDDYTALVQPFEGKNISDSEFNANMRLVEEKLGIIINQNDIVTSSYYKRSLVSRAVLKIKNAYLKITKKPVEIKAVFKGKIMLNNKHLGATISNIEKTAKVYDFIFKVAVEKQAKIYRQENQEKVSKEVQFAARLFANILMCRVSEFNTNENHEKLEKCLWLQFANFVNKYNMDSKNLATVTGLGANAVADVCKQLGITKDKIIEKMIKRGYSYTCIPVNEVQALLSTKGKDTTKYSGVVTEATSEHPAGLGVIVEPVNEQEKQDRKGETISTTATGKDAETVNNSREVAELPKNETLIKKSTIEKMVDKIIIKFLSTQGNLIADKIDNGKFKGKKLQVAEAQLRYYNLILSYYVQASNGRTMNVKNNGEFSDTEISRAKAIVLALLERRTALVDEVKKGLLPKQETQGNQAYINAVCKNATDKTVKEYYTKLIKYWVEYCLNEKFNKKETGQTDEEFINLINADPQSETKPDAEEVTETSQAQANIQTEQKPYVPNFIILNEKGEEVKPYVPNFVYVEDRDNGR